MEAMKVLEARPDTHHYWKVVRVSNGDVIMAGLDEAHAKRWAASVNAKANTTEV